MLAFPWDMDLGRLDQICRPAVGSGAQGSSLAWAHRYFEYHWPACYSSSFGDALVARIRVEHLSISMQQFCCRSRIMDIHRDGGD